MGTTALFGAFELLIMLALAITFLVSPGHGTSYTAPLQPGHAPHAFGGILAGMVFSILALSGFEAPAPLAQETRRPGKFIGRAVMLSLFLIGGFYIFTSYASTIGWGTGDMAAFAAGAPDPDARDRLPAAHRNRDDPARRTAAAERELSRRAAGF